MELANDRERSGAFANPGQLLSKVPEITIYFWIIKVLCTTVGETVADFLNVDLGFGLNGTSIVMSLFLAVVLAFQFRAPRYIPGLYWLAVVLISVVGTLITDNLIDNVGASLITITALFSITLVAIFAAWHANEKTLSIHSIYTPRREAWYWLAILFTFALGTAGGDLAAEKLALGYSLSAIMFGLIIAAVTFAHFRLGLNGVVAFWAAYILTRPLGASMGDFLTQPTDIGGLGLGSAVTSGIFLAAILATVIYLVVTKRDVLTDVANEAPA